MPLATSVSTRLVLHDMAHIADKAIASSNDGPASLAAMAENLRQPDSSYRPLVIKVQGGNDLTIGFSNLPADNVKAGGAIRDRIATALLPTLMTSASSAGKRISDETVFLQARKIAMLIADGSLHQAVTQPVKDGLPNMGEPQSALNVVLSSNDHFPAVTLCHSATWRDDDQKPLFETNLVARFSVNDQGNLMADHDVHFYADPSVALTPRAKTGILESIQHFLKKLFQVRHIEITPCSMQTAAELEHLKMIRTPVVSGETGQGDLRALNDLAKDTFTARYSQVKTVNTGDTHDLVSPIYRSEEALLDKLHHAPKETFSALRNGGINVQVNGQNYACSIAPGDPEKIIVAGPGTQNRENIENKLIISNMIFIFNKIVNRTIIHSGTRDLAKLNFSGFLKHGRTISESRFKARNYNYSDKMYSIIADSVRTSCGNCGESALMAALIINLFSGEYLSELHSNNEVSVSADIFQTKSDKNPIENHAFCVLNIHDGSVVHKFLIDPWKNIARPLNVNNDIGSKFSINESASDLAGDDDFTEKIKNVFNESGVTEMVHSRRLVLDHGRETGS